MAELYDQFNRGLYKLDSQVSVAVDSGMEMSPESIGGGTVVATQQQAMGSWFAGKTGFTNVEAGYILGIDKGVAKFYIGDATNYLNWTGTSLVIAGSLTVSSGTIGGFTISATAITATNLILDSSGQRISLGSGNDIVILDADDATYRLWIGHATAASAPFSVSKAGAVTATNITITGGSVGGTATVGIANVNIAARGWTQTSVFSVTDADTIAWGAGTFTSADGTAYSISSGNTGNMAAATYIYLDIAVSTTAYQTTTTAANAVGAGKVLVAKAQNGTGEATFQVFGGIGGTNIDASSIVANSITANELSTSITYAGSIIISSAGLIRSGQTDYNTGTGWWIGNASGTPKLSIGNPSGKYLTWDGTNLLINGYTSTAQAITTITAKSADTTRTISNGSYTKLKEFAIGIDGDYDVYFEIRNTTASGTTSGRVYKNGVATGTERNEGGSSFAPYNETIAGLVVGDLIQFYGKKTIDNGEVKNFRLRAVLVPGATVNTN